MRGRLRAIRERGGKVVVIDPRRTRTAEHAAEHHFIRPGTDALLLFALVTRAVRGGPRRPRPTGRARRRRSTRSRALADAVHARGGRRGVRHPAGEIRRMARELARPSAPPSTGASARRPRSSARWRAGSSTCSTCSPATSTAPGGAMFPLAAAAQRNSAGNGRAAAGASRRPLGEPGARAARGVRRAAGVGARRGDRDAGRGPGPRADHGRRQPAASRRRTPRALERAVESLDFMVSLDIYVNETTRHADVILPAPEPLARAHYDLALYQFAVRNVANYSPPVARADDGPTPQEWEIAAAPRRRSSPARAPTRTSRPSTTLVAGALIGREVATPARASRAATPDEIAGCAGRPRAAPSACSTSCCAPARTATASAPSPTGSTLERLEASPHGIDLGPLRAAPARASCARRRERSSSRPEPIVADVPRLERRARRRRAGNGRHGPDRPPPAALQQLLDAQPAGAGEGQGPLHGAGAPRRRGAPRARRRRAARACAPARASSTSPVEVTDEIMPGVVSIPHGWGHDAAGRAAERRRPSTPGVNSNLLADETRVDAPSGNAVLNGIPVEVVAADREPAVA